MPCGRHASIGRFEQILELQAEVGRAVAGKMLPPDVVAREAARARRVGPVDEGVYETYLRGEFHVEQLNPVSLGAGGRFTSPRRLRADPGFAVAWAGLAQGESAEGDSGGMRMSEITGRRSQAARRSKRWRSIRTSPKPTTSWAARGLILRP